MPIDKEEFRPEDITIRDDAWQKKTNFYHIETWYFDGIFTNNYNVVSLVSILTLGNFGFIQTGCYVYKDTNLVFVKRERPQYKRVYGSENHPLIKTKNRNIVNGQVEENSKNWIYEISMGDSNSGFDLQLKKTMKAWKGQHKLGNWLVIPHFDISGVIHINGENIDVVGHGYHDHNAYPIFAPAFSKGYHFGKLPIDSLNVTWARVMKRFSGEQKILVLNKENDYININSKDIQFTIEKQVKDHGKIIPDIFSIVVENEILKLNIKMETLNIDRVHLPFLKYWRYHVRYTGDIKLDSISKKINKVEIAEYLRFF
jgi:hypothetical protein